MTSTEFENLKSGNGFIHRGKTYKMTGKSGPHVIGQPVDQPMLRIHFYPHSAPEMKPAVITEPEPVQRDARGFAVLKKAPLRMPSPYIPPDSGGLRVAVDLDILVELHEHGGSIPPPLPGAISYLRELLDSGCSVTILTRLTQSSIYDWLHQYAKGLEMRTQVSPRVDDIDKIISARAIPFTGTYPAVETLTDSESA